MRWWIVAALALVGCGRFGFDPIGDATVAGDDAAPGDDAPGDDATPSDAMVAVTVDFAHGFGGSQDDLPSGIARDSGGNIYLVGNFYSSALTFGGAALSGNSPSGYLASFTPAGVHRWSRTLQGTATNVLYDVVVDASNSVYVTGSFAQTIDAGGGTLTSVGASDIVLASYDESGGHRWSFSIGGTQDDAGMALTIDRAGNVVLAAAFQNVADFGAGALIANGSFDIAIARYSPAGASVNARRFGGGGAELAASLTVDASNNLYVAGWFAGSFDLGGPALTAMSNEDLFVASLTPTGAHRWSRTIGVAGTTEPRIALAIGGDDHLYVAGGFAGQASIGGPPLTSAGSVDMFVGSLTTAGTHRWSTRAGGLGTDAALSIAEAAGEVYVGGEMRAGFDLGGGVLTSAGDSDVVVAGLSSGGIHRWSRRFGGTQRDFLQVMTPTTDGALVAGVFRDATDLGTGLTSAGGHDIFLMRLTPQ